MSLEQTGAASEDVAESPPSSTAIIGAGPTGLVTAIMLARRGWTDISVSKKERGSERQSGMRLCCRVIVTNYPRWHPFVGVSERMGWVAGV
eukprot:2576002-Rhodomonas_salina.1